MLLALISHAVLPEGTWHSEESGTSCYSQLSEYFYLSQYATQHTVTYFKEASGD